MAPVAETRGGGDDEIREADDVLGFEGGDFFNKVGVRHSVAEPVFDDLPAGLDADGEAFVAERSADVGERGGGAGVGAKLGVDGLVGSYDDSG